MGEAIAEDGGGSMSDKRDSRGVGGRWIVGAAAVIIVIAIALILFGYQSHGAA